jgi:hypothetical protein
MLFIVGLLKAGIKSTGKLEHEFYATIMTIALRGKGMLWCCGMDFVEPLTIIISVVADNSPDFDGTRAGGLILAILFHINITLRLRAAIVVKVRIIEIMDASTLIDLVVDLMSMAYFRGAICHSCRL